MFVEVFGEWNHGELESFLIEITRDILKFHDTDGTSLIDKILDTAGQVAHIHLLVQLNDQRLNGCIAVCGISS